MKTGHILFHDADKMRAGARDCGTHVSLCLFDLGEAFYNGAVSFAFTESGALERVSRIARAINEIMGEVAVPPSKGDDDAN